MSSTEIVIAVLSPATTPIRPALGRRKLNLSYNGAAWLLSSLHWRAMVTSVLFQPFAFGAGVTLVVVTGGVVSRIWHGAAIKLDVPLMPVVLPASKAIAIT